ncbi:MAG: ABC transporter ATP-binding protein [Cephaloticoccus sp.]|nr:ABC transporter ATP-binding protein [Cephaloticoccus sp.]MCF7759135.1 ABC transporter ATP-binding protein [Cephaloticoccus sp.]
MNKPASVLSAHDLHKTFVSGDRRIEVLRGASLEVAASETVSIRGESGTGKSTLLHLLARLDEPEAGTVTWSGAENLPASARAVYLGMVFQSFYLIPEMDALANVLMAARMRGRIGRAEQARARDLLNRVGLGERSSHLPNQLSGGERQRVALARALMNQPCLILADEPTGNLDEHTGEVVIELLLTLCRETNTSLVLVTHNVAHASRCGRQLHLHSGLLG